jgi:hypothetical protein
VKEVDADKLRVMLGIANIRTNEQWLVIIDNSLQT